MWVNYLSNGLKYGGASPQLTIGADETVNGFARFWVRDQGDGLTVEEQSQLFTEFTRLNDIQVEGHGLGLSIVRRIITKLGGEVGVNSCSNEGCEFYFTLPAVTSQSYSQT